MFCSSCGERIPGDSAFCPECGIRLAGATTPPSVAGLAAATATQPVSSGMNIGVILSSLFIPLIGLVMGVVYVKDSHPEKQRYGRIWLWVGGGAMLFWILASIG